MSLDKTETSRKEVERLKKENDAAIMAGDGQKSEVLDEKIRLEELNLKNLESENKATQANLVAAEKLSKKAEAADAKAAKAAEESAESKITYANQLAFMARREKEAVRWQSKTAAAGAAIIGAGAGAVAGSAFGPVGTVIGATVGAFAGPIASTSKGARYREGAAELKKQYGTDGTVKKNASKKEKELKILSEQLKESGGDSKPESADEEK